LGTNEKPPWVATERAAMDPCTVQLNIFGWNKKLTKHVKAGQPEKVRQLSQQMQREGMSPEKFTLVQVINACSGSGTLEDGMLVHKRLIQGGCESDVLWGVTWWACMQNAEALRRLGECSTRCHLEMWSFGMPWYWDK
jgi:pentatricopeptide repeat protein